jgi:hypothetical protein
VSDNQRTSWKTQHEQLLVPVQLAAKSSVTPAVTDDTLAAMSKLLTTIRSAKKEWESDMAVLEAAKTATATLTPVATLAVAWEQRLATERAAELKKVEESRLAAVQQIAISRFFTATLLARNPIDYSVDVSNPGRSPEVSIREGFGCHQTHHPFRLIYSPSSATLTTFILAMLPVLSC